MLTPGETLLCISGLVIIMFLSINTIVDIAFEKWISDERKKEWEFIGMMLCPPTLAVRILIEYIKKLEDKGEE